MKDITHKFALSDELTPLEVVGHHADHLIAAKAAAKKARKRKEAAYNDYMKAVEDARISAEQLTQAIAAMVADSDD